MINIEIALRKLYTIPEPQWFERRTLAIKIIEQEVPKSDIIIKKMPINSDYMHIIFFKYQNESFVYFELISPKFPTPIINWFQLEKRVYTYQGVTMGDSYYATTLILSSDDQAKVQGQLLFDLLDRKILK